MQTNYNYGAIVGFMIIVLVGAVILGAFLFGAFDPEKQSAANRENAEVEYLKGKYAQELAASQAELDANIANAPAMAQLAIMQKQQELQQQQAEFELASDIRKVGMLGFLLVAAAGLIVAIGYVASRTVTVRQTRHGTASPSPEQSSSSRPPQQPPAGRPTAQPVTNNGHDDLRKSAYWQMWEANNALTTQVAGQVAVLGQKLTDLQAAVEGLKSIQVDQAMLTKDMADMKAVLQQHGAELHALEANVTQHNGQWHAIDVRETPETSGSRNGTYIHTKEVIGPQAAHRRKAA